MITFHKSAQTPEAKSLPVYADAVKLALAELASAGIENAVISFRSVWSPFASRKLLFVRDEDAYVSIEIPLDEPTVNAMWRFHGDWREKRLVLMWRKEEIEREKREKEREERNNQNT